LRPIFADFVNMMKEIGMLFKTEILWYKQNVAGRKTAWGSYLLPSNPNIRRCHEYILVWCKDQFKLEGDPENADMTDEEFQQWTTSVWFVQPETRNLGGHPVPFSCELTRRVIKLWCYRGDLVVDPFTGSGTTAFVAKQHGRRYYGIDNNPDFVEYAKQRVNSATMQVFDPSLKTVRRERLRKEKAREMPKINIFEIESK
jgi:modification methylase